MTAAKRTAAITTTKMLKLLQDRDARNDNRHRNHPPLPKIGAQLAHIAEMGKDNFGKAMCDSFLGGGMGVGEMSFWSFLEWGEDFWVFLGDGVGLFLTVFFLTLWTTWQLCRVPSHKFGRRRRKKFLNIFPPCFHSLISPLHSFLLSFLAWSIAVLHPVVVMLLLL